MGNKDIIEQLKRILKFADNAKDGYSDKNIYFYRYEDSYKQVELIQDAIILLIDELERDSK